VGSFEELRGPAGTGFAEPFIMTADVVIGRMLACCVHPAAAWRRLPTSGRAMVFGTYFAASYLGVLTVLLAK
jgi:hypothetical protein